MKKQILTMVFFIGVLSPIFSQKTNRFDVEKFENALIQQMEITFPKLTLDTTLNFVTRATSQEEAGYPDCYGTKRGGMVNTSNDEIEEARKLVYLYKKYLEEVLYMDKEDFQRCRYTEFCVTATEQFGGLVRYGIVIDNNITHESLFNLSDQLFISN
jgi:hypothetical protein